MTPIKLNRAPLTKRISALAITAAAALTFSLFSPSAEAAPAKPTNEYKALDAALRNLFPTKTVETATPDELKQALTAAISAAGRLKPGNIAGEALKYSLAEDAGDEVAQALTAAVPGDTKAVADAVKRAGSGKDIRVVLVPGFVAEVLPDGGDSSLTLALAKLTKASKPGTGAVIGGRALDLAKVAGVAQAEIEALVNDALAKSAGLSAAAQDITKYAAEQLDADGGDTAELALDVAKLNIPLATKVVVGAVAGDPLNGGPIVNNVLDNDNNQLPKLKSGILPLVKGAAAVADIEEISHIAVAVGRQIGKAAGSKTAIALAKATSVVKTLASAIVAKSTTANPANNTDNKGDEIAEVAAFMVGHMLNENTVNGVGGAKAQINAKNAGPKIYALVLGAINVAKSAKVQAANPGLYAGLTVDVSASVAETLGALRDTFAENVIPDTFFDGIVNFLKLKAKQIAAKSGIAPQTISDEIDAAYATGIEPRFEEGTPANVAQAETADPETDFRNF